MKYIDRDSFKIGYEQNGDTTKTPILVVGSSIYYPRLFADEIYKDLNIIFIDHRGFLKPEKENDYALDKIADDIEAVREDLGANKIYILGHSGHGFMAMAYALKYREHVEGVILSNLAPTNTKERQDGSIAYFEETASKDRKDFFYEEIVKLPMDIQKDPSKRFSHMNIRMQAHAFYDYKYDGAYLWDDVYNNLDALDHLWGVAFAQYDTKHFIDTIDKPVLLLLSDYDYLVSPTTLWNPLIEGTSVEYHNFDHSGHNPMLEEAHKYHDILSNFVNKN